MKNYVQLKNMLLGGAAIGMFMIPAMAQEQQTEIVTVTGIRASLQSAQAIKQNADSVVDSISAVDIGALPDRNVAEALQRVPGVTLQRNDSPNDLVRLGSTGNSVFVRGLSWVQTTMNGRAEFSAVDGRTLNFADVSADLLSGVDVYKSPTAKMIEGGIGGVVDLKTRMPFDQEGFKLAVSGDYTYGSLSDRALPSANALISDRWNTSIGEIGVLASVDWQDQLTRTAGINVNTFDCWDNSGTAYDATSSSYSTCMGGTHEMAPKGFAWRQMDFRQQRLATNFAVQWRPSDKLEVSLSAMNTYAHFTDIEHWTYFNSSTYSTYIQPATYTNYPTSDGNVQKWVKGSGVLSMVDTRAGTGHDRTSDVNLNVKWNPSENFELTGDVQFVESDRQYLNNTMYTGVTPTVTGTLDISGDIPKISATSAADLSDPNNYYWYVDMDHMDYNSAHAFTARLDGSYKFHGDGLFGIFKSVDAGVRTEQKLSVARSTGYNWVAVDAVGWGYPGVTLAGNLTGSSYTAVDGSTVTANSDAVKKINSNAELFHYQSFFGSSVPALWLPKANFATQNMIQTTKLFQSIEPSGSWVWSSYATQGGCTSTDMSCIAAYTNVSNGNNVTGNRVAPQQQQTYAGYAQANYAVDNPFGWNIPIDGNLGVRVIQTENEIAGGKLVLPALNGNLDTCTIGEVMKVGDPTTAVTSCADFNTALAFWGTTSSGKPASAAATVDRPAVKSHYWNVLPSFNLRAKLSDTLQARAAYSETMLRPDFSYTQNNATLQFNWDDQQSAKAFTFKNTPSGYGGNPSLKPMHSTNVDVTLEWYFAASGSVTVSLFDKRITNYIYTQTTTTTITNPYSGASYPFAYTTYVNGTKGGVEGWEVDYHQFYDFLPGAWSGLGIEANYTKIYNWGGHNGAADVTSTSAIQNASNANLPMEGMSHDSYNLALMYAKYDIDARLAWSWRSTYMSSSSNSNDPKEPVWLKNYGQLDGSVFYSFLDHYKVGVQLTNITGSRFNTLEGYPGFTPQTNWIQADRKYAIVVRTNW